MRLPSFRLSIRTLMIATAMLGLLLGAGVWTYKRWNAPVPRPFYIQPLEMDEEAQVALDKAGVEVNGFEYSIPKGHFATITVVARDAKGLLQGLSTVHTVTEDSQPVRVRLMRLDPDEMREEKTNRLKWVIKVDGSSTSHWIDNPEKGVDGTSTGYSTLPRIENPQPGKTYAVWDYNVTGHASSRQRKLFSIQLRFRFDPVNPKGPPPVDMFKEYQEDLENPDSADPSTVDEAQ